MKEVIFQLDNYDAWSYIFIGVFSAFSSIIFFSITYAYKKARQFPGNLLLLISIAEFVFSILNIIQGVLTPFISGHKVEKDHLCCLLIGHAQFLCFNSIFFFQIFFMIAIVYLLKSSLKNMKYKFGFVLMPLFLIMVIQSVVTLKGSFGMDIHGNCGLQAYENNIYAIILGFLAYAIVFLWTSVNLFSYKNISFKIIIHRKDFIQFYIKYCIMYFAYFFILGIQLCFDFFAQDKILNENTLFLKLFFVSKIINNVKIFLPLLTLIIRLDDPYIRRLFQKIKYRKNFENTTFLEAFNLSNQDFLVNKTAFQIKNQITSSILYSLDNFYNYWLRSIKTLDENVSQFISLNINDMVNDFSIDISQDQSDIYTKKVTYSDVYDIQMQSFHSKKFYKIIKQQQMNVTHSFSVAKNDQQIKKSGQMDGGNSGEFFLLTYDKKYIIKTITLQEFKYFQFFIQNYFQHININSKTYLCLIIGLFCFQFDENNQIYIIVMQNIFQKSLKYLKYKFDLKGSKVNRRVLPRNIGNLSIDSLRQTLLNKKVLKDLDFEELIKRIKLDPYQRNDLMQQIIKDVKFLRDQKLIDYSLLVGVIDLKKNDIRKKPNIEMKNIFFDEKKQQAYIFGIIDYFQRYDFQKKLERFTKTILLCKFNSDVSVTNPAKYSERFFSTLNHRIKLN